MTHIPSSASSSTPSTNPPANPSPTPSHAASHPIVTIEKLVFNGYGLGFVDGKTVFVENVLPQDCVEITITKKKRKLLFGKPIRFITQSPLRSQTPCRHFPDCGGCQLIDTPYNTQRQLKTDILQDTLRHLYPTCRVAPNPIIGSKQTHYYRNKMEFSFGTQNNTITLGLKQRGNFKTVVPISECLLQDPQTNVILDTIRSLAQTHQLEGWNHDTNTGYLKSVIIRQSKSTHTFLLNFIVHATIHPTLTTIAEQLKHRIPAITSILATPTKNSHLNTDSESHRLLGDGYLHETLGHLNFKISPLSFFQTNSDQAKILYDTIKRLIPNTPNQRLLDLYCGTGTIGLYCADKVASVIGIEENPHAIQDAIENTHLNAIQNAEFHVSRVKNWLKFNPARADSIIIDPPRSGMTPKALTRMCQVGATTLIYVSCNPSTFTRDAIEIEKHGYTLQTIIPVDMFPNTFHLELVTCFTKQSG